MFVVSVLVTVCAVASPELSIVATAVFEEVQVTESVRSTVFPFWRMPVAVNCAVSPEESDWLVVVMEIEDRFAAVTVTVVEPLSPFNVALIVAVPDATPVTSPIELTVAMVFSDVDQLAESVTVSVVPLSYAPVATICCVLPTAIDGVEGDTVTVVKVGPIKKFLQPAVRTAPRASVPKRVATPHSDRTAFAFLFAIPPAPFLMNRSFLMN
jgi:hypothetical protein